MGEVQGAIREFITKLKELYPALSVDFEYDQENDQYSIWHLDPDLQFNNTQFLKDVGRLIKEELYSKDIFNFSFGYDYFKARDNTYHIIATQLSSNIVINGSVVTGNFPEYNRLLNTISSLNILFDAAESDSIANFQISSGKNADIPNYPYEPGRLAA